jgi:hypothetical protein
MEEEGGNSVSAQVLRQSPYVVPYNRIRTVPAEFTSEWKPPAFGSRPESFSDLSHQAFGAADPEVVAFALKGRGVSVVVDDVLQFSPGQRVFVS